MDWSQTPLGPVATWPQSLRTALSMMLESRFAMVVAWGPEFRFFYNDRYVHVLADKHPRALGTPAAEIFPEIWNLIGPEFERTRRGESFALDDWYLPLERSGYRENCWFTVSYSPIRDETGGVGGMLAVVAETTGRVESERRLATLRELAARAGEARTPEQACTNAALAFGVNATDVPFAVIYALGDAGRTARKLAQVGLPDQHPAAPETIDLASEVAPWPLGTVTRTKQPLVLDDLRARFGELPGGAAPEATSSAILLPLVRPGLAHPYGVLVAGISPRRALDDRYRGFYELAADHIATAIGNAHALEQQRRRAEELADLDRAKTVFFSNVSHEFRTPLALMLGPLEDLLAGRHSLTAPELRAQHELVHRNALRLHKLVNTMLDFSRIEAGRARAAYEETDLAAFTIELAGMFRAAIERAGLELLVDCPPLPEPVFVDREMWEKIVLNLLSNALKFTFHGRIRVTLRHAGDFVELAVRDTGGGIAADQLPRVFERFHRVERARSRTHEGTGIGLALALELARLHGGTIEAESEPGAGTQFTVRIRSGRGHLPDDHVIAAPRAPAVAHAPAYVEEALRWLPDGTVQRDRAPQTGPTSARVLVVDDNADMRDYLRRTLEPHWAVSTVADGAFALGEIRRAPPDAVITDVMMPGLDGFALIAAIRADERTRDVPVIIVSARAGEEARVEGLQAGADDYLVKPFSARELVARVGAQIATSATRRAAETQRRTLYTLFEQLPASIAVLRLPDLVYEMANRDYLRAWPATDLVGRRALDVHPQLRGLAPEQVVERVRDTREAVAIQDLRIGERWYSFAIAPLTDASDSVERVIVFSYDVTDHVLAREHAELQRAHLHSLFMQAPTPICILRGPRHVIELANDHVCAVWRRAHADVIGRPLLDALPEIAGQGIDTLLDGVYATGVAHVGKERRVELLGEETFFNFVYSPMRGLDGTIEGVLVMAFDVTDELRARADQARTLEYNEKFTAMLGHDLRNPLNAIATTAQLLQRRAVTPEIARPAARIIASADRMTRMISQLLDLARVRAGVLRLQRRPLDLGELCQLVLDELKLANPDTRLELSAIGSLHGRWDGDRLAQVISNLASNAIEHGEPHSPIHVQLDGHDADRVSIRVENRGAIEPEILPILFDPFRGVQYRREKTRGLGLGLYISKEIVAAHRGTIDVRSSHDTGTCFEIELPKQAESVT